MGKGKKSKYFSNSRTNPAVLDQKLKNLDRKIVSLKSSFEATNISYDNHLTHLGNFARHDIKNAILNMDSILSTTEVQEFDLEKIQSLQTYLDVIRNTVDNFAKLIPYSSSNNFSLSTLIIASELLSRDAMIKNQIDIKFDYSKNSPEDIKLPFQAILQMINNLLINSIKSLEEKEEKKIHVEAKQSTESITIKIRDNGKDILAGHRNKIFDFGYSTTGGSGIGLYHAKYLCEKFNGSISLRLGIENGFNKEFTINLPTTCQNGSERFNN